MPLPPEQWNLADGDQVEVLVSGPESVSYLFLLPLSGKGSGRIFRIEGQFKIKAHAGTVTIDRDSDDFAHKLMNTVLESVYHAESRTP